MITADKTSVSTERTRLQQELRSLVINYYVEQAEAKQGLSIVKEFAEQTLFLQYLSDTATHLMRYGNAWDTILEYENDKSIPRIEPPVILEDAAFQKKCHGLALILKDCHSNKKTIYDLLTKHLIDDFLASYPEEIVTKARVSRYYGSVFQTETFSNIVKQPVRDRCRFLANELSVIIPAGLLVYPKLSELPALTEKPDIKPFLSPSRTANPPSKLEFPTDITEKLNSLKAILTALEPDNE